MGWLYIHHLMINVFQNTPSQQRQESCWVEIKEDPGASEFRREVQVWKVSLGKGCLAGGLSLWPVLSPGTDFLLYECLKTDKRWCYFCPSFWLCDKEHLSERPCYWRPSGGSENLGRKPHCRFGLRIPDPETVFSHYILCWLDLSEQPPASVSLLVVTGKSCISLTVLWGWKVLEHCLTQNVSCHS